MIRRLQSFGMHDADLEPLEPAWLVARSLGIWRLLFVQALVALTSVLAQESKPPATLAELQQRLTECISQPKYASAFWGIKVSSLDTGKTLFEQNAQKLFSPASNSKLYIMALVLDSLGADCRIKTSLYAKSRPSGRGVLKSDLIVYGRGDPSLNARLHHGDIFEALEPLVFALTNAGIKRIAGNVIADRSFFRGPEFGSGWAWDDLEYYYGAEISALTLNDNTLQATVRPGGYLGSPCKLSLAPATTYLVLSNRTQTAEAGAKKTISFFRPLNENVVYVSGQMPLGTNSHTEDVTVHDPAGLFVWFFRQALVRHGVAVTGKFRTRGWLNCANKPLDCTDLVELGSIKSPPLRELVQQVQKPSNNLYTDLLLAYTGETFRASQDPPELTSEELGIRQLNRFLGNIEIPPTEVILEEGSGLSRDNLTSPNATVTLLRHFSAHKSASTFIDALPIASVDGSLRNRMKGTPAAGNVRAKTGSLRWANSLSGYVTTAAGERLVFSLMLNRYNPPQGAFAREDLDAIAVLLASFTGRSRE